MRTFATPTRQRSGPRISPGRGAARVGRTNDAQRARVRHILHPPRLQPKLTIGASDDASEREADRIANSVLSRPAPQVSTRAYRPSTLRGATDSEMIRRQEPVTTVTISAVVAKCIIGAITGALVDAAIQSVFFSIRERTWRFWQATLDYCSIILSAILGCIAAPISAIILDGWVTARLGTRLGGVAGTLVGKILLFIAKKLAIGIPKGLVGKLAKLGCISPEQAGELGVERGG